jgi:hypothetical protein
MSIQIVFFDEWLFNSGNNKKFSFFSATRSEMMTTTTTYSAIGGAWSVNSITPSLCTTGRMVGEAVQVFYNEAIRVHNAEVALRYSHTNAHISLRSIINLFLHLLVGDSFCTAARLNELDDLNLSK